MSGKVDVTEAQAELIKLGAPKEVVAALADRDEDFILFEENYQTFCLFISLTTQWRVSASGGVYGLDYNVLFELFSLYGIKKKERLKLFEEIRLMESAALSKLRETT